MRRAVALAERPAESEDAVRAVAKLYKVSDHDAARAVQLEY